MSQGNFPFKNVCKKLVYGLFLFGGGEINTSSQERFFFFFLPLPSSRHPCPIETTNRHGCLSYSLWKSHELWHTVLQRWPAHHCAAKCLKPLLCMYSKGCTAPTQTVDMLLYEYSFRYWPSLQPRNIFDNKLACAATENYQHIIPRRRKKCPKVAEEHAYHRNTCLSITNHTILKSPVLLCRPDRVDASLAFQSRMKLTANSRTLTEVERQKILRFLKAPIVVCFSALYDSETAQLFTIGYHLNPPPIDIL